MDALIEPLPFLYQNSAIASALMLQEFATACADVSIVQIRIPMKAGAAKLSRSFSTEIRQPLTQNFYP
jgi:hypothetical protein